jgi:hypothetical protein
MANRQGVSYGFHPQADGQMRVQRMKKDTTHMAKPGALVYAGDIVQVSGGNVLGVGDAVSTVSELGIVVARYKDNYGRPPVHGLPDQHPNISLCADSTDYFDVMTDGNFVGRFQTSAGPSQIGTFHVVTNTARVTAAGRSGNIVTDATVATAAVGVVKCIALINESGTEGQGSPNGLAVFTFARPRN